MTNLDLKLESKSEWIEMFPFGVAMGANHVRPVMIFKDSGEKRVLPVWMNPMDAGIAVTQANTRYSSGSGAETSPHELSWQVLSALQIRLEKCLFREVKGHKQYVELHFRSEGRRKLPDEVKTIEAVAGEAISFCMRSGCRFYATVDYIEKSRVLESEIAAFGPRLQSEVNPHRYLN